MSWGVHKAGGGATGQTRRRGVATVDDVVITKELDKSSPKLAEAVLSGKVFPKVEIHNTATYGEGRATFLKYELKNVAITSHSISASGHGDAVPHENMSLNFEEVKKTYVESDEKGTKKGNVEMCLEGRGRPKIAGGSASEDVPPIAAEKEERVLCPLLPLAVALRCPVCRSSHGGGATIMPPTTSDKEPSGNW